MLKTRLKMLNTKSIEGGEGEVSQKIQRRCIAFRVGICYNKEESGDMPPRLWTIYPKESVKP